jgi:hypothetical protein
MGRTCSQVGDTQMDSTLVHQDISCASWCVRISCVCVKVCVCELLFGVPTRQLGLQMAACMYAVTAFVPAVCC